MISSSIIIATTSSKRWFDLDAVRTPVQHPDQAATGMGGTRRTKVADVSSSVSGAGLGDYHGSMSVGAPPLDWHADGDLGVGHIVLADHWAHSTGVLLEGGELARKVVLSACPWAVCRVCGVARERVVETANWSELRRNGASSALDEARRYEMGMNQPNTIPYKERTQPAPTLGWTDCGHDNYRPGIVYDPYAAPGVAAFLYRESETSVSVRYVVADTREFTATLADESVDLIFTSPPFLALRSYLPADHADKHREIGSEANPAAFLDTLLELTAQWRRVLAPHGTLAVELGDTYSGGVGFNGTDDFSVQKGRGKMVMGGTGPMRQRASDGWPLAKSLACIPQLYQIALAYGINPLTGQPSPAGRWRVRNVIAWHRPNPPVGALGDKWRPASSSITVACTGAKRWFDLDAVRVPGESYDRPTGVENGSKKSRTDPAGMTRGMASGKLERIEGGAPPLDWHTDGDLGVGHIVLATQPYSGSHYATFPMELPRKIIDCMCPRQVCAVCGKPRERLVERTAEYAAFRASVGDFTGGDTSKGLNTRQNNPGSIGIRSAQNVTLGWSDCGHDNYRPGIVFDPFVGTGTTLAAAQDLGRDAVGCDLDPRNAWLARERVGMFLEIEGAAS